MVPALIPPNTPFPSYPSLPSFPPISPIPPVNKQANNHVYVYATFVPVWVCFIIIVAVWRVKRINRIKKILVTSVIVIPKENQNHKKQKINAKKQKNNYSVSTISFPREPMYKSQGSPAYLVPFTALPPNFDYSLKKVEVHSDFVVIKDLKILQTYWYEKEEYKKPTSYNTNFIRSNQE